MSDSHLNGNSEHVILYDNDISTRLAALETKLTVESKPASTALTLAWVIPLVIACVSAIVWLLSTIYSKADLQTVKEMGNKIEVIQQNVAGDNATLKEIIDRLNEINHKLDRNP